MQVLRVVLADDDAGFRRAVAEVLADDARFDLVAQLEDGLRLPEVVAQTGAHVALIDLRMAGGGPEVIRRLRGHLGPTSLPGAPRTSVVAISADTSAATVAEVLVSGATGFLTKGRLGGALPDLVARCADGEVVLAVDTAAEALRLVLEPALQPAVG